MYLICVKYFRTFYSESWSAAKMRRLMSTTGCLCYDPLLKSDDQVQFTHIYMWALTRFVQLTLLLHWQI